MRISNNTKLLSLSLCIFLGMAVFLSLNFNSIAPLEDSKRSIKEIGYKNPNAAYLSIGPVKITSKAEFEAYKNSNAANFLGDGNVTSPYIIMGIEIDGDKDGNCLHIENVGNITIQDSYIEKSDTYDAGIYLKGITNCTLFNNTIVSNGYGIQMVNCQNTTITRNALIRNKISLRIEQTNTKIYQNDIYENYFLYSELVHVQDTTKHNTYDNGSMIGNFYSKVSRSYDFTNNFSRLFYKGTSDEQNVTIYYVTDALNNYSINSQLGIFDMHPLIANDTDSDGLNDLEEAIYWLTNISLWDTDADKMPDGWEAKNGLDPLKDDADEDPDEDDLDNLTEYEEKYENENAKMEKTDPQDADTDNDGWKDGKEVEEETSPVNPFDHPDYDAAETFQISFGLVYLIFMGLGIISLLICLRKKLIIKN
ncbi:MAG: hypothetical protein EU548_03240 [Promethearchaeota archaeon]|nr:MAG: hypothetical protein EU548_03240 [Candidatus Lokiarchaeota archaeon]